jgi:hypothetical protein
MFQETVTMPINELYQIARELWPLIEGGECVAWIGSGLSKNAGYPLWSDAIDELCSQCGLQRPRNSEKKTTEKLMETADNCRNANPAVYQRTLASLYGKPVSTTRHAFYLLMKLPFRGYVTTNFDPLLSHAGATFGYALYSYPDLPLMELRGNRHPIFYIHGLALQDGRPRGDNLIFSSSEFKTAYEDNEILRGFLVQLLTYCPIFFMGCSLAEEPIYKVFQRVHKIHTQIQSKNPETILPRRYILLPERYDTRGEMLEREVRRDNYREDTEEKRFQEMKIEVKRYKNYDSNHSEIEQILEYLCVLANTPVSPQLQTGLSQEVPSC